MYDTLKLKEELKRDEGLSLKSYKDSRGYWTIGIGHLLGDTERMSLLTIQEVNALLEADIHSAIVILDRCVPKYYTLDDVRMRALINMAFNRGYNMVTSTTITPAINKAIATNNWSLVKTIGSNSEWAKQVGDRATRLLSMLELGEVI